MLAPTQARVSDLLAKERSPIPLKTQIRQFFESPFSVPHLLGTQERGLLRRT